VAELVDALDLGSSAARRESSSLSFRTIILNSSSMNTKSGNAAWQDLLKQSVISNAA